MDDMNPDDRIAQLVKRVNECERMQGHIREKSRKLEIEVVLLMVLSLALIILMIVRL